MIDERDRDCNSLNGEDGTSLDEILPILERLIGFDTTSHKSNLQLISYIETVLSHAGVPSVRIPNETGDKASLYAKIGPDRDGGVGLSGHTDVVPVAGQAWDTDPFTLTRKDQRVYGRGTTDMKGFLAVMLAAVPLFQRADLQAPVHLLFSYDEEIGCTGVRPMIEQLGKDLPVPDLVLVGEPSTNQVVDAHKGIYSFETVVTGVEAHSSVLHQGVSAILIACQLVEFLRQTQNALMTGPLAPRFDPAYSTVHVGEIHGGTARNIVARQCRFAFEVRALPGFDGHQVVDEMMHYAERELLPGMKAISSEAGIETALKGHVPGLAASPAAVELGLNVARQNASFAVSYGTEAGLFEGAGMPAFICGPGHIEQAHKPNEFIELGELTDSAAVLGRLAQHLAKG